MKTHMKEHISNQPSIHEEQTIADDINNTLEIKGVINKSPEVTGQKFKTQNQTRSQLKSN